MGERPFKTSSCVPRGFILLTFRYLGHEKVLHHRNTRGVNHSKNLVHIFKSYKKVTKKSNSHENVKKVTIKVKKSQKSQKVTKSHGKMKKSQKVTEKSKSHKKVTEKWKSHKKSRKSQKVTKKSRKSQKVTRKFRKSKNLVHIFLSDLPLGNTPLTKQIFQLVVGLGDCFRIFLENPLLHYP